MVRKWWRYLPPVIIYTVIFYLSSRPASTFPDVVPDIIPHFIEYLVLAYFSIRVFGKNLTWKQIVGCSAALLFLAVLDELHQYYVPTRFFELKDILVDLTGILTGIFLYMKIKR